jgi:hypothetical protein
VQQGFAANTAPFALAGNCPFVKQHRMLGEATDCIPTAWANFGVTVYAVHQDLAADASTFALAGKCCTKAEHIRYTAAAATPSSAAVAPVAAALAPVPSDANAMDFTDRGNSASSVRT